ncbi:MAG: diguanylate cyclase [Deltaproteobacteria bacterium]
MSREILNPSAPFAVVVNDDVTQLKVLSLLVRRAGLEPHAFTGAEAALAGMADRDSGMLPALVVTDLYMPGIDGWRFCRLLRSPEYAAFNRIPILVVSATFAGDEANRIAADLGAEAFLPSPVDGRRFVHQVEAIMKGEQLRTPLRVLIVESDKTQSDIIRIAFEAHGYQVATAFTVRMAADAFNKTPFDVAVLDYHLPDGTGDTLLDTFCAGRPECVCLMMTTDPGPELALIWMRRGAAAYLRKPFEPAYLIELCVRARRERALLRAQDLLEVSTRKLRDSEQRYRELSIVDDLTQLYNSRHFYFQLKIELDRSNRYRQPLTLLLLDLDDFKVFNDTYGHVEGDQVLMRLGQVVKRCLRQSDSAYRYGGEEFTIILPMTTSAEGAVTAERIRTEFKKETFSPVPGQDVNMTASIGLAQYKVREEMKAFIHRVDQLMYQGKKNGKDRVCSDSSFEGELKRIDTAITPQRPA